MDACVCANIKTLSTEYDDTQARALAPLLNTLLGQVQVLLSQYKSLARQVQYRITPTKQRTTKALDVKAIDPVPLNRLRERYVNDVDAFWLQPTDPAHVELRRRLACVVIFLRSRLEAGVLVPPVIANIFEKQQNYEDVRGYGKKYIKIARKLGGLGSIFWLPFDIPPSTYERYLNMDDEKIFNHLRSLKPRFENYTLLVQRLTLSQLCDLSPSTSYLNLFVDYSDFIPPHDQLLLLLYGLGGSEVPDTLLRSIRLPQRRWNASGEMDKMTAEEFGLPLEIVQLLSDDREFIQSTSSPHVNKHVLPDGTIAMSLSPYLMSTLSQSLLPHTIEQLGALALKLLCFACPPCYEGNTSWSAATKKMIWPLLERAIKTHKVEASSRTQVLEAILYFCERDSVAIRRLAVEQSRIFLRKSMPYHLHASVVLFRSILHRINGELAMSEAEILDFHLRGPQPVTRLDHAIQGRLHISQVENKTRSYHKDVSSFIYKWEAAQPLSSLDIEVTSRLQSAAARYFQFIGDFVAARASLEQFLSLHAAIPIRDNTRRLLVGRLADVYCEMKEFTRAVEILQLELDKIGESDRPRRPFRRLILALAEANIGLGKLDFAESVLKDLEDTIPPELDDTHDQQLHMRRLFTMARIVHLRHDFTNAILRWEFALKEVKSMRTLKGTSGFTAAMIYLSMAHAQLSVNNLESAWQAWDNGVRILESEQCEFWIPTVPTIWLQRIAAEVYESQGWTFDMKLPGGISHGT
ncbi:hypothetical protein B0I35DRAFT_357406 [Stachybotrys elegans]|uniref:Uncharacterized protein n=1 Tax=Stachybotrys elegans TaxID=80388 RepID=A0A8K0SQW6_9HYPO|nr:hypothetical protein B0I35DRAFT_357406 [Stachybotrys elegans]